MKELRFQKKIFAIIVSTENRCKNSWIYSNTCIIPFSYAASLVGFHLSFKFMSKSKKSLETSLDLAASMKTSVDAMVESLVSNMNYLDNRHRNFNQKKYGRNRCLPHTHVRSHDCNFSFCMDFLHLWWKV